MDFLEAEGWRWAGRTGDMEWEGPVLGLGRGLWKVGTEIWAKGLGPRGQGSGEGLVAVKMEWETECRDTDQPPSCLRSGFLRQWGVCPGPPWSPVSQALLCPEPVGGAALPD